MEYLDLSEETLYVVTDYCGWLSMDRIGDVETYLSKDKRNFSLCAPYIVPKALECCVVLDRDAERPKYDVHQLMTCLIDRTLQMDLIADEKIQRIQKIIRLTDEDLPEARRWSGGNYVPP
jgi:hypothetical protein